MFVSCTVLFPFFRMQAMRPLPRGASPALLATLTLALCFGAACSSTPEGGEGAEESTDRRIGEATGAAGDGARAPEGTPGDEYLRTGCVEGDCQNGEGIYVYADGAVYKGAFQAGRKNGRGEMFYANGDVYKGPFEKGERQGFGTYTYANGDRYVGEFLEGRMKGMGAYRFADGATFKGTFQNDGAMGDGTFKDQEKTDDKARDCTVENRLLYCRN